jgi:signal peptidase I
MTPAHPHEARSKRWLAAMLSLLAAGLGHVYAGRPLRAAVIAVAFEALAVLGAVLANTVPARVIWLGVAAVPLIVLLIAADAARIASRPRTRFLTRRAVVLACGGFLLVSLGLGFGGDWARQRWGARPFRSPSGAMFPTLLIGDHFYVDAHTFREREPERGDVVVFEVAKDGPRTHPADLRPELPSELFVKRILGLPGDRIAFQDASISVNGEPVETRAVGGPFLDDRGRTLDVYEERVGSRAWQILDDPAIDLPEPTPITVPEGRYFVLGDNRDHSKDSRFWGTVARDNLHGPVTQIYWSWDFNGTWAELLDPRVWWELLSRRTRWDRVGLAVQ